MGLLAAFKQPEYIGENRCWPCTIANGAILLACCLVLVLLSPILSSIVFVTGMSVIALRGYLVPYTPELTTEVKRRIAGEPTLPTGSLATAEGEELGVHVAETLLESGVLIEDGERLFLAEGFRGVWRTEMKQLRALSDAKLLEAVETTVNGMTVELLAADRPLIAVTGPEGGEVWVSRPVAIAEAGAERALSAATGMTPHHRLAAARALRSFLDRCPVCEERVEETSLSQCCGNPRNTASGAVLVCPSCDEWLYRFPDG
jgi:hypothetical protein